MSALIEAIQANAPLSVIEEIVKRNPESVKYKDGDGWTALHHAAAEESHLSIVQFLIHVGWDALKEEDKEGRLPLHVAAKLSRYDVVKALCEECSETITQTTKGGMTPLHFAALRQPLEVVQFLFNKGKSSLGKEDEDGCLPLHLAAQNNNWMDVVEFFVRESPRGALQRPTKNGRLPLHLVAARGSLPMVEYIANQYGQAVDVRDVNGWLPLHFAARFNPSREAEVVKFLVGKREKNATKEKAKSGKLALHLAAEQELFEAVQFLAAKDESALDVTDENWWLPLHAAADTNEDSDVVQFIYCKRPEQLLRKDKKGRLPIHLAIRPDSVATAMFLAKESLESLQVKDGEGRLPLHIAARCWKRKYFEELLRVCPPEALRTRDSNRRLLIDMARQNPDPEMTRWLKDWSKERQTWPKWKWWKRSRRPFQRPDEGWMNTYISEGGGDEDLDRLSTACSRDRKCIRALLEQRSLSSGEGPVRVSLEYVGTILTCQQLGVGRFGAVYKGRDPELNYEFAVKMTKSLIVRGGSEQRIEEAVRSFKTEQKALSRFRHPNISALIAYTDLEGNGSGCLLYEFAENGSLDQFLQNDLGRSRLSSFVCRSRIAVDVLTAIRFLHVGNREIVSCFHRDIKSANILLKRGLTAQLTDCGIAKFVQDVKDDGRTSTLALAGGTPGYTCPQLSLGRACEAACDIFSFGVVLVELWTGRMQNYTDESGSQFEFHERYVTEKGDIIADVDRAMGHDGKLPDYMQQYAMLALSCMFNMKDRPAGGKVLETLHSILKAASPVMEQRIFDELKGHASPEGPETCKLCRSWTTFQAFPVCLYCLVLTAVREGVAPFHQDIRDVGKKVDLSLPLLADLHRKFINEIPRNFVLVPADITRCWRHPRSWLRSKGFTKYYLFFVCHSSKKAISPPIKLHVAKEWIHKVAPVLAYALLSLQIAAKIGFSLDLKLCEAAKGIIDFSYTLTLENIADMVREVSSILNETNNQDLMERIKSEVQENKEYKVLSGDAYELVREKAHEQREWQSQMKAVRKPPDPRVVWVANAVADDPKNELVIVNG